MYRFFYSLFFYLAVPFVLLRLLRRSIREPGYRAAIWQRFGFFQSAHAGDLIWIHAVSAGETVAAAPLIRRLAQSGRHCVVTNMTPTGRERVQVLLGDLVENAYVPYDLPGSLHRFIRRNRPRLLVMIDTELWPNMLAICEAATIPTMLVNGRLSARSQHGYSRIAGLSGPMLRTLDLLAVQTEAHGRRFEQLGVDKRRINVTGSIKFDAEPGSDNREKLALAQHMTAGRPVLLAASTHDGEESVLFDCLPSLLEQLPDLLLVLAPRHTFRAERLDQICRVLGHRAERFSRLAESGKTVSGSVLMIDVMGELDAFFALARVAFIGGSLVPIGGHNLLEAVRADTPVVMGSHLDNVEDIAQQFIDHKAMRSVKDQAELQAVLLALLTDKEACDAIAAAAREVMLANLGAVQRVELLIEQLLHD